MSSLSDLLNPAGPPQGAAPALGGVPSADAGIPGQPDNPDAAQALDDAIHALNTYMGVERDRQDLAVAAQCLARLHGLSGGRAKEINHALGMTPSMRLLSRQQS